MAGRKTVEEKFAEDLRNHLRQSIEIYLKLVSLTDRTYVNASDMLLDLNWRNGLRAFRADMKTQLGFLDQEKAKKAAAK